MVLLCWNCKQRCTDFVGDTKTPKFPFRKKHPEKTNKETQKKMRHENKLIQHTTHWLYLVAAVAYQTNSIWSLWHARVHRQIKFIFLHLAVRTMLFSHCALWSSFVLFHHASGIERGLNEFVCQSKKKNNRCLHELWPAMLELGGLCRLYVYALCVHGNGIDAPVKRSLNK